MRRYSERQGLSTLCELNITPLLDLAFVLLIIFMITTPLMENSTDLVLPSSRGAAGAVDPANVQVVSLSRDRTVRLNAAPVGSADLVARLAELRSQRGEIAVVLRCHRELPVQEVVDLMTAIERVGVAHIGLVTNPED